MNRIFTFLLLAVMIAGAAVVYDMKRRSELAAEHVASVRADIDKEKERIRLLRAEWSVLAQPSRIQALVDRYKTYLDLQPADVKQIVGLDDVPSRPIDTTATGSIAPAPPLAGTPQHKPPAR